MFTAIAGVRPGSAFRGTSMVFQLPERSALCCRRRLEQALGFMRGAVARLDTSGLTAANPDVALLAAAKSGTTIAWHPPDGHPARAPWMSPAAGQGEAPPLMPVDVVHPLSGTHYR